MKRRGAGKAGAPRELPGRLALDTSTYSHLARGDERVIDALARADAIFVPTIVLGELGAHLVTFDSDFDRVPALPVTVLAVL